MTLASLRTYSLLTLATLSALLVPGIASAQIHLDPVFPLAHFPDIGGGHTVTHRAVWRSWSMNRLGLGRSTTNEFDLLNKPGQTPATAVLFENGAVVRHNAGVYLGKAYAIKGSIWIKYVRLGAFDARLGLPKSDPYLDVPTARPWQTFEKGFIYWNITFGRYDVKYFDE